VLPIAEAKTPETRQRRIAVILGADEPATQARATTERSAMADTADPRVDAYIAALPAWQQAICREVRALIHAADPAVTETIKRTDRPYFVLHGNIAALQAARDHVNIFLYDGGLTPDPAGIITGGHGNATGRTIAIRQGETLNAPAFTAMVKHIIATNRAGGWRQVKRRGNATNHEERGHAMTRTTRWTSMDAYIAAAPADRRAVLEQLRAAIRAAAPEAQETISYNMPAFAQHGTLVYFALQKHHIGFYPTGSGIAAFQEDLAAYAGTKGAVHFPLDQPVPVDLIQRIVRFRVEENRQKAADKAELSQARSSGQGA
jgi:uncharacterized protein YdhG (YjbR/CyaY superfamily)